jgi:hypothetical protein
MIEWKELCDYHLILGRSFPAICNDFLLPGPAPDNQESTFVSVNLPFLDMA